MATPINQWDEKHFAAAVSERDRRQGEAMRLYRPRPEQMPFHCSRATERLVKGGNRSGKTVCAAVEVDSAALGVPIVDPGGGVLEHQYPAPPLVIWLIGFDERHIARMGRKLFKPGLFRCVKDPETGRLRIWKGFEEEPELADETVPAPPLIPKRMIKPGGWAWENKAKGVFSSCELTNGTILYAFPSGTEAAIGDAVDLIWVDEDVQNAEIIPELLARLVDVEGRFIWSSWPRVSNNALLKMHDAALKQAHLEEPDVFELNLTCSGNPYLPPKAKQRLIERWTELGDAVVRARDRGEFVTDAFLVFPTFNISQHGMPRDIEPDALEKVLAQHNWKPPIDWTWYLGIDPGHTHQAAVALVIPPDSVGDFVLVAGEVYQEQADAEDLAAAVAKKWPDVRWEAFVIDLRAGRQTSMGLSTTVTSHYEEAFANRGIRCRQTGFHFVGGSDDIASRNMLIRRGLAPREDGTTRLRFMTDETRKLQEEFHLYKKRGVSYDDVREDVIARDNDVIDALAYIYSHDPMWREIEYDDDWEPRDSIDRFLGKLRHRQEWPDESICMGAGAADRNLLPV